MNFWNFLFKKEEVKTFEKQFGKELTSVKKVKDLPFVIEHTDMNLSEFLKWGMPIFKDFHHYLYYSNRMSGKGHMPSVTYNHSLEETDYKLDSIYRIKETDDDMDFTELTFYFKEEKMFEIFYKFSFMTIKFPNYDENKSLQYSIGAYQPPVSNLQISIAYSYFRLIEKILQNEKQIKRNILSTST